MKQRSSKLGDNEKKRTWSIPHLIQQWLIQRSINQTVSPMRKNIKGLTAQKRSMVLSTEHRL